MAHLLTLRDVEIRHAHFFCGIGLGALGFNRGSARIGTARATMQCLGGIDVDAGAIACFDRLVGVKGTVLDLFDREQYTDFHGRPPPDDWRPATADDIRRAFRYRRPHIVFLSAPCKGFSGLNASRKGARKYVALNRLTLRGIRLMLEAWADDLPELIVFENVPLIATSGRPLLDEINALLRAAGYAVAETMHNCGELGGLGQNRRRFLLVARHREKVGPFLYEPPKRGLRSVGEVIGSLPVPGGEPHHPMHRLPALQWRTWVRLALIEAGSDWRSLEKLAVEDGHLRDLRLVPARPYFTGALGVKGWGDTAATVTGESLPFNGAHAVADPRPPRDLGRYEPYGVVGWDETGRTVTGEAAPGAGPYSVADPRAEGWGGKGKYRITSLDEPAGTVIAESTTGNGAFAVADPRYGTGLGQYAGKMAVEEWGGPARTITGSDRVGSGAGCIADPRLACDASDTQHRRFNNCYRVVRYDETAQAVTGGTGPSAGGQSIADPRITLRREHGFTTGGQAHYGVKAWDDVGATVTASGQHDNGPHSVADPRPPDANEKCTPLIVSLDETWHRPFTTLELAALQSFPVDEMLVEASDAKHREWIGNGVPPDAAAAIASEMAETLLLAWAGQTFQLSAKSIWVLPVSIALSMEVPA